MSTFFTRLRQQDFRFWIRIFLLVLAPVLSLVSLLAGEVRFSDRDGTYDLRTIIYYTLGLFVFGGLDLGVPEGGQSWARLGLWTAYFLAPAVTASAVIEAVFSILRLDVWRLFLRDHVVIGGCGRLALVFIEQLKDKGRKVVVVERHAENPHLQMLKRQPRTRVLIGDVSSESVLETLKLKRATKVYLLTGDDYVNLDAALRIQELCKKPTLTPEIWAHVSDIRLLRPLNAGKDLGDKIFTFNGYRTAARHLVKNTLVKHFDQTPKPNTVVLAGFGRFGQTILSELQQEAAIDRFKNVIIIDREAQVSVVFEQEVGFGVDYEFLEADMRDPRTWDEVWKKIAPEDPPPVFTLACSPDEANIHTAMSLAKKYPHAKILVRCFRSSLFTQWIMDEYGFQVFSPGELLYRSTIKDLLRAT